MATKKKELEDRKATVGISITNSVLAEFDRFCFENNITRSATIEELIRWYLANLDEWGDLIFERGYHNAEH